MVIGRLLREPRHESTRSSPYRLGVLFDEQNDLASIWLLVGPKRKRNLVATPSDITTDRLLCQVSEREIMLSSTAHYTDAY